jgi:hypothetical protein
MWRTEDGDRALSEGEWQLFATGLDLLLTWVESDVSSGSGSESDIAQVGMKAFDLLTPEQKYAVLADVSEVHRREHPLAGAEQTAKAFLALLKEQQKAEK